LALNTTNRFELEAFGATDVGMKRRLNEDVFYLDHEAGVYLVADGMGGHAAGEVASRVATEEIVRAFKSGPQEDPVDAWPEHWNNDLSATANLIVDAIVSGHHCVTVAMNNDADLKGMGTTVVVAVHHAGDPNLVICHVGDSRAYRFRRGCLALLTSDHSWVHEQVEAGFLTEEAARTHPLKNVVTQALGGTSEPRVDVFEDEVQEEDLYLLCSDGLNSMLTDDEIAAVLEMGGGLEDICDRLIVEANERGGNDNISVVLLRPRRSTPAKPT
jgi:serine/threonine protein phosphatase PrpC